MGIFHDQLISLGGAQNWPSWSPNLTHSRFTCMELRKNIAYERKLNSRQKLYRRMCDAAKRMNDLMMYICKDQIILNYKHS
jgi:hypothetical protein